MIDPKHRIIFVRNPKTASQSIQRGLWGNPRNRPDYIVNLDHLPPIENSIRYPDYWQSCIKFTCVRHPIDRIISMYYHLNRYRPKINLGTFEDWARNDFPYTNEIWIKEHQSGYNIIDQIQYVEDVDFIIRFECIDKDFRCFCETIGIESKTLGVCNTSNRDRNGFPEISNSNFEKFLNQRFRLELERFDYPEFPGCSG